MSKRRRFTRKEKSMLYQEFDGLCALCKKELPESWHADHKQPFSKGGKTRIVNGQSLCPVCNRKKGNNLMVDNIKYRPVQQRLFDSTLNKIDRGDNIVVANIHPGSGKTLGSQAAVNELYRRGLIDTCLALTPRLNLCQQYELDWKNIKQHFGDPKMNSIIWRNNSPPLLRGRQFGYVTTYQSLVSDPGLHLRFARKYQQRFALILDEAQMLGHDYNSGLGTQAARIAEEIGQFARFIIVMSGTPYRADGKQLIFATYTEPDSDGVRYLQADVSATYQEGVTVGYLRKFEYELFDGRALYEYLGGSIEELTVSKLESGGLKKVIENEGFFGPIVDKTVEVVRDSRKIDGRFCGLIGAYSQDHARDIIAYLKRKHSVKALIAVSDEKLAQDNLRQFKTGQYEILVTVAMAHVGYDYKPITVVTCLNAYRWTGWLDQFFARGMRVIPDIPYDAQYVKCLVPDDPKMRQYVEDKRRESELGLKERQSREAANGRENLQQQFGKTTWAVVDKVRAMGLDPQLDLDSLDYQNVENIRKAYVLGAVNLTGLGKLLNDLGKHLPGPQKPDDLIAPPAQKMITDKEWEKSLRGRINLLARQADKACGAPEVVEWGFTYSKMYSRFNKGVKECDIKELEERIDWLEKKWLPEVTNYVSD